MIQFVIISRSHDGLPLAANSDSPPMGPASALQEAYKYMKVLSRISGKFPDRCTFQFEPYTIHFISALGLTYLVLCEDSYPAVLAMSFLDEIQKEFLQCYEKKKIEEVQRPYALIDFDITLQKLKQRYNNTRSLTTRLNLAQLSQELKMRPPYMVCPDELRPGYGESKNNNATLSTTASLHSRYLPSTLYVIISLGLNCFCALLNLSRGIVVINEAHIDSVYDSEHYQYGATFLICCFLSLYQIYLIINPLRRRKALACATLASNCLCQLYLWEYRNNLQILFHVTVACYGTFVIFTRKVQEKLPQYTL
ncbi:hypothetical protein ACJMK2_023550 [Sinanodonta woodiana]|uniref:Longin domain-containing protein n=1 Tax=Sinanodonta woodiana TaxID=1069815 RepID=A0ABD3T5Y0_SINWO